MPRHTIFLFAALVTACRAPAPVIDGPECMALVPLEGACERDAECDDGCFCNGAERCAEGACAPSASPCTPDDVECTVARCDEAQDRCEQVPDSSACADDDRCNGSERCDPTRGCVPGVPLDCDDGIACTIDACDATRGCTHEAVDLDGDGYGDARCGGTDCDDSSAAIHPGAGEICDNGVDDDCDEAIDGADDECRLGNEDCGRATALPGPGIHHATTLGYTLDESPPSCVPSYERPVADVVFTITLAEPSDLVVRVDDAARPFTYLAIRAGDGCRAGPDLQCVDPEAFGDRRVRSARRAPTRSW